MSRDYAPIDRDELTRSPEGLAAAEIRVRAVLASRPTLTFSPTGLEQTADSDVSRAVSVVTAALSDIDWIEGFRRGIEDADRAESGKEQIGPGASNLSRDDWSPSLQRVDAYAAGFERAAASRSGQSVRVLPADEMPDNNAQLAAVEIDLPPLEMDSADSCPTGMNDILGYLAIKVPDGESLVVSDLTFLRTAQVEETRYWIWRFTEPDGRPAYATCSVGPDGAQIVGCDADYYGLTPEQFILGDYHQVF